MKDNSNITQSQNFYEILQLPNFSDPEDIKVKYKELIKNNHPDKGGSTDGFELIKIAYNTLKDPDKKSEYDRKLKYNSQLYEKAEDIQIYEKINSSNEKMYEYECIQCFSINTLNKNFIFDNGLIHIVKCGNCSMIYKITQ